MMKQTWIKMILAGVGAGALAAVCVLMLGERLFGGAEQEAASLTVESRAEETVEITEETTDSAETIEAEAAVTAEDSMNAEESAAPEASPERQTEETEVPVNLPAQEIQETQTDEELYEEMKEYLAALPDTPSELGEQGCYVNTLNGVLGAGKLDAFWTAYQAGEAAELVIAGYTIEGDVVFDYLKYDGEVLRWVHDSTRDGWAGGGETYLCESYLSLLQFYRVEDSCTYRDFVLTDDADLTYEEYYSAVWGDGLSEARIWLLHSVKLSDNTAAAEVTLQAW